MRTEQPILGGNSRGVLLFIAASLFVGSIVVTAFAIDAFPRDLVSVVIGAAIGAGLSVFSTRQGRVRGEARFAASSLTAATVSLLLQLFMEGEINGGIAIALAAGTAITLLRPSNRVH